MDLIYQRNWSCTVKDMPAGDLLAETFIIGTEIEAAGRLIVDKRTFEIKDAVWEVYRSPGSKLNGSYPVPGLKGVTAYFNAGGELRRIMGNEAGGLARELLAECVRGIIQAETFLYLERGYPSPEAYGEYWEKYYVDSCRYYSNLHRISRKWPEYVENFYCGANFFNRTRSCSVFEKPGGITAAGNLSDSFHEMGVVVDIDEGGRITGCTGNFLRAPDRVCFENASMLEQLKGIVLPGCSKKQIGKVIGGAQGCDHLVDLVNDLGKTVEAAKIKAGGGSV